MKDITRKNIRRVLLYACILITIILSIILVFKTFIYKDLYIDEINLIINEMEYESIDPYLILAIIKTESNFNVNATSPKEAKGLMQVLDNTYKDIEHLFGNDKSLTNDINLYDPYINLSIGISYFNLLLDRYDSNIYLAIIAYNAGLGNVNEWLDKEIISDNLDDSINNNIPYGETKRYLEKVITTYNIYTLLY